MNVKNWVSHLVIDGIKNYPVVWMLGSAVFFILLGVITEGFGGEYWKVASKLLFATGTALIGGGAFTVISQSSKYTSLIQEHLETVLHKPSHSDFLQNKVRDELSRPEYLALIQNKLLDVFMDPSSVRDQHYSLQERWRLLSESRLKGVLPELFKDATQLLEKQFFNTELEYHFEDYSQKYDISIDADGLATVINTFKAKIVKNKAAQSCIFRQGSSSMSSEIDLRELEIKGQRVNSAEELSHYFNKEGFSSKLSIDLNQYTEDKIRFKRVFSYTQDLKTEPFIIASISKYIMGGQLKVKVPDGYEVTFNKSGINLNYSKHPTVNTTESTQPDTEGYRKWVLASTGSLLLPGEGYILIITPKSV